MFLGQNVENMIVKRLSEQIFEKNKFGGFMSKKIFSKGFPFPVQFSHKVIKPH